MPCNAVVTVTGRLAISPAALFEGEATAHAAALARLAPQVGIAAAWVAAGMFRIETAAGVYTVTAGGEVWGPAAGLNQVRQTVNIYLAALARQKALLALRRLGRVTAEQALPGGAVVVNLEVT